MTENWRAVLRGLIASGAPGVPAAGARSQQGSAARKSDLTRGIALYAKALEKMRQGLCVFDGEQRLLLFNRRYAEMYKLDAKSLRIGMTLREVVDLRYAAGTGPDMTREDYASWRHAIAVADVVADTVVELRNGNVHEIHHEPLPGGGWVATFEDITARRKAETELQASEERYRALVQASAGLVWRAQADGSILGAWGWDEFSGRRMSQLKGRAWLELLHPDDRGATLERVRQAASDGRLYEVQYRLLRNGEFRWVVARGLPLKNPDGTIREWSGTVTDIHDRKMAEDALHTSSERLRLAVEAGRMVAWEIDPETKFVTRSENSWDVLGLGSGPLPEYLDRVHAEDRAKVDAAAKAYLSGAMTSVEFRYNHPRGDSIWLEIRAIALEQETAKRLVGVTFDVTARKLAEKKIWRAANRDPLTGLANRAYFQRKFEETLSDANASGSELALLLLDLDNFKEINDTLGHDAGDALLEQVAGRLCAVLTDRDFVGRLGGDEFALVLVDPAVAAQAREVADRVLAEVGQPCLFRNQTIIPRASIGIAAFPAHDRTSVELLKDADMALYAAKAQGRHRVVVYSPTMRTEMDRRVSVLRQIRHALREGQVVPYYQPRLQLSTGKVTGFEALARWRHPSKGLLLPGRFSSVFDDPELAVELGTQMVDQVARDIRTWRDAGLDCGQVAVNLSPPEFLNAELADRVLRSLARAGIPPDCFEVEVTETVFLGKGSDQVGATLERLHAHGVRIALDDFGTGFASLSHLKRFPIDLLKIDQSFIRDLERDPDDAAIVAAVIGLGNSLRLDVTAEGVETTGQADFLRAHGCDNAQGFLFAKPMAGSRVPWFLQQARATRDGPQAKPIAS